MTAHVKSYDPAVAVASLSEVEAAGGSIPSHNPTNLPNNLDEHRAVVVVVTSVGIAADSVRVGVSFGRVETAGRGG